MSGDTIKPEDRPGWRPKPGAENTDRSMTIAGIRVFVDDRVPDDCIDFVDQRGRQRVKVENTDRAQVASLGDSAIIRPDSATATVKDSLMVDLLADLTIEDAQHAVAEHNRVVSAGFVGWRGHLPICRGPGGIAARRMRRAGIAVRGVRR